MTSAHDPLEERLRLLREASLPAGFEERLARRLVAAQQERRVLRLPGRKRMLLLVAAIAIPAAAAAARGYYLQGRSSATSAGNAPRQLEAKALVHMPETAFTVTVPLTAPAPAAVEELPAPRTHEPLRSSKSVSKGEKRQKNEPEGNAIAPPPSGRPTPHIEALDPFASQATQKSSAPNPKGMEVSESLRKATEQGAARNRDDSARALRRDAIIKENRGNDAARQSRERVQARERKGQ